MNVLDLFSGIGGFSLGLERAGMRTVAFCEIDPYCRAVLRKHWPDVPIFEDVRTLAGDSVRCEVICGGFPCQDISVAGEGAGIGGERSGLWQEFARLIREIRPRYVIVENVAALLNRGLERVLGDLATLGFDAEWHCIPASAIGAPHERDRVWIIANPAGERMDSRGFAGGRIAKGLAMFEGSRRGTDWRQMHDRLRGMDDGVPYFAYRGTALGNAVVPQIPEIIGRAILEAEKSVTHNSQPTTE